MNILMSVRKLTMFALIVLFLLASLELRAEEAAIRAFMQNYLEAFNAQNLEAVSAMRAEKGIHVDSDSGTRTEGRAAIRNDLSEVFKQPMKTRLAGSLTRVRIIKSDVIEAEGTTTTTIPDVEPSVSHFTAILVKEGEKWQINSLKESAVPQSATAADALQKLDWLVGEWVDDSKESPVISNFRWSINRSFLIRSFSTKEGENAIQLGTQVIGWDPRSQQIRSWTFNADGSFGDGVWSFNGVDWLIKSSQTLADGSVASGTYVITTVDENTLSVRLMGHEVEGEPVPSSDPVQLVRLRDLSNADTKPSK